MESHYYYAPGSGQFNIIQAKIQPALENYFISFSEVTGKLSEKYKTLPDLGGIHSLF